MKIAKQHKERYDYICMTIPELENQINDLVNERYKLEVDYCYECGSDITDCQCM